MEQQLFVFSEFLSLFKRIWILAFTMVVFCHSYCFLSRIQIFMDGLYYWKFFGFC